MSITSHPILTQDGSKSIKSDRFGLPYHSEFGAITESMYIYIDHGLKAVSPKEKTVRIFEMGLGTGLNLALSIQHRAEHQHLHYECVEAYPLSWPQVQALDYDQHLSASAYQALKAVHEGPSETPIHVTEEVSVIKHLTQIETMKLPSDLDVIYFDAFGPNSQAEPWSKPVLKACFEALKPGGIWVTFSAQGALKRRLRGIGFELRIQPGPPGKREMIQAVKQGNKVSGDVSLEAQK